VLEKGPELIEDAYSGVSPPHGSFFWYDRFETYETILNPLKHCVYTLYFFLTFVDIRLEARWVFEKYLIYILSIVLDNRKKYRVLLFLRDEIYLYGPAVILRVSRSFVYTLKSLHP